MLDKKYIDLMNQEIDGINTREESAELQKYVASNPEAQQYFDDIKTMSNMLSTVSELEPPPTLKKNIMTAIKPKRRHADVREPWWRSISERLRIEGTLKYAYVFSCGLILGLFIYALFMNTQPKGDSFDISRLYGTMALKDVSGNLKPGDLFHIDIEDIDGRVHVAYSESIVIIELQFETQQKIELALGFEENDITVYSYAQAKRAEGTVSISQDHMKLTHAGDNTYHIFFNKTTPLTTTLNITINADGALLYERPITIGQEK